jgi:aubergine-like protein
LEDVYKESSQPPAKLAFIVVTKKGNTRIFKSTPGGMYDNPPPGTIVDDVITLPERLVTVARAKA